MSYWGDKLRISLSRILYNVNGYGYYKITNQGIEHCGNLKKMYLSR